MLNNSNDFILFAAVDNGILRLQYEYIPKELISGITKLIVDYRQNTLNIDQLEEHGNTVLRSHPPRVTPVTIIVRDEELKQVREYLKIKSIDERRSILTGSPELEEILNRFVLSKEEMELNRDLRKYCEESFGLYVSHERNKKSSTTAVHTLVLDMTTTKEDVKKRIHDFYAKFAELETKNLRNGNPVFSERPKRVEIVDPVKEVQKEVPKIVDRRESIKPRSKPERRKRLVGEMEDDHVEEPFIEEIECHPNKIQKGTESVSHPAHDLACDAEKDVEMNQIPLTQVVETELVQTHGNKDILVVESENLVCKPHIDEESHEGIANDEGSPATHTMADSNRFFWKPGN
jgi:hypothetical protein